VLYIRINHSPLKTLLGYLRRYYEEEFRWGYFLLVAAFVFFSVWANLHWKISALHTGSGLHHEHRFLHNLLLYAVAFLIPLLLYIPFAKERSWLRNPQFWLLVLFALSLYAFRVYFYGHQLVYEKYKDEPHIHFWIKCLNNLVPMLLFSIPVFCWWYFNDRQNQPLYGLSKKHFFAKPYFLILLLMIPVIAFAALQPSFQKYYPHVERIFVSGKITENKFGYGAIFETCYGIDFITTEFFFRGFMILAFAKYLGRAAILPMAAFYVFVHFGKPPGEAISAFFGGTVLGIFAYETKSIWGGVIVHLGTAWMMELAGMLT
jgi:membrane protease YdiL (CAAX protease family)